MKKINIDLFEIQIFENTLPDYFVFESIPCLYLHKIEFQPHETQFETSIKIFIRSSIEDFLDTGDKRPQLISRTEVILKSPLNLLNKNHYISLVDLTVIQHLKLLETLTLNKPNLRQIDFSLDRIDFESSAMYYLENFLKNRVI